MPEYPAGFVKGNRGSKHGWCPECRHPPSEMAENAFYSASSPVCPRCQIHLVPLDTEVERSERDKKRSNSKPKGESAKPRRKKRRRGKRGKKKGEEWRQVYYGKS